MALNQGGMASNQETTEPDRRPRDRKVAGTEAARLKKQGTRRGNYEKRMEKQHLAALAAEEQRLKQRERDEGFMREALYQAKKAAAVEDIPIGCMVVCGDRIAAKGYSRHNTGRSVLSHAEIISIKRACRKMGDWRLKDCTMYVTLELYPMCAGAIVRARISGTAVGCMNPKAGCAGSMLDMLHVPGFNHQAEVAEGVLEQGCLKLMSDFFRNLRERRKK